MSKSAAPKIGNSGNVVNERILLACAAASGAAVFDTGLPMQRSMP